MVDRYYCPTCGGFVDPFEHDDIKRYYYCHGCSDLIDSVKIDPKNQTLLTIATFDRG